jgi:hypothetical protein
MPNHITNRLTIIGTEEQVAQVRAEIKGENEDQFIDFNTFVAIPKELQGTISPMTIISQKEYDIQEEKIATDNFTENERNWRISRGLTRELSNEYKEKFGTDNWYDWQTRNWGTKWNAYKQVEHDENELEFDTAWSTPLRAMEHLSKKYPQVEFQVRYADEDFGYNVGEYSIINGEIESQNIPDGGTLEALEMAMDIKGDEDHYLVNYLVENEEYEISSYEENLIQIAHNRGKLEEDYPTIVLEKLKELALADEQFERVIAIDKLLAQATTKDDEDYQSGLLYGVDNNQ